jgi:hypothetical protein
MDTRRKWGRRSIDCWDNPQNLQRRARSSSKAPLITVNIHPNPEADVTGSPEDEPCRIPRISSATETPNAVRCAGRAAENQSRRPLEPLFMCQPPAFPQTGSIGGPSARSVLPCFDGLHGAAVVCGSEAAAFLQNEWFGGPMLLPTAS